MGLPPAGPGSAAGWPRRILALFIDWFAALGASSVFLGSAVMGQGHWENWVPLAVFWAEASLLTALVGGSFGQLLLRVAVVRLDRRPLGLLRSMLRTLLICLVVPPAFYNRDRRGLHDLATGTVTLRR